jgi:hypothetical protein
MLKYLDVEREDLVEAPLWFHKRGLMQTASGYGRKLTTEWKAPYNGKLYRVYCTIFSNSGSLWIQSKGEKLFLHV